MSPRFQFQGTPIAGLLLLHRRPIGDHRGNLERFFCIDELQALMPGKHIAQVNCTRTKGRGTVRGMHFQHPPHAETKFVSCLRGEVFDVAIDLRCGSPTFLHSYGQLLDARDHTTLLIPEGFAHGFQALTDECEMLYLHTSIYRPDAEGCLNVKDPRLNIRWPLPVSGLSPRDAECPYLGANFSGVAQ